MTFLPTRHPYRTIAWLIMLSLVFHLFNPFHSSPPTSQYAGRIQYAFPTVKQGAQNDRLQAVMEEFEHSWKGYKEKAWMFDELRPVTGGTFNKFCGWAATLVDSLDTLYIFGMKAEWEEAVKAVATLDFSTLSHQCTVDVFETTIRHLGGLLAAYDLDGAKNKVLYQKSVEVGEMIWTAFNTTNGLPCANFAWPKANYPCVQTKIMSLAGLGSLNLEFTRLAAITGDEKYANAILHVADEMSRTQSSSTVPGLWPRQVDPSCMQGLCPFTSSTYSLGSDGDSTYEYVLKSHLQVGAQTPVYRGMWSKATNAIRENHLFKPMTPENHDILFSGILDGNVDALSLNPETQHLACFLGGVFGLSHKLFNYDEELELARKLTDGCVWAYESTKSGIMPETFHTIACDDNHYDCPWNETRWLQESQDLDGELPKGFKSARDTRYLLRPEAIESVFVMYRITGDSSWRDKGWKMFSAIRKHTRAKYGHSGLSNVLDENPGLTNEMESFWLAETLKYFYLLFSDPSLVSLDDFVLNTEAHPLRLVDTQRAL